MEELKNKLQKAEEKAKYFEKQFNNLTCKHEKIRNKYSGLRDINQRRGQEKKEMLKQFNLLKFKNNNLKKNLKRLESSNNTHQKFETAMKTVLTDKQIYKVVNSKKKFIHWDAETISRAITLHSFSGAAYRYLQKINYPLPSRSCLKRWALKFTVEEGILYDVIYMMQIRGITLQPHQKIVILSFDEVYLSQREDVCKRREQEIGRIKQHKFALL